MIEYYQHYLLYFIPKNFNYKLLSYKNELFQDSNLYIKKLFPNQYESLGIGTLIAFTICEFMLFFSLFRVCFSDPGYLPSPLELEWKAIETVQTLRHSSEDINEELDKLISVSGNKRDNSIRIKKNEYDKCHDYNQFDQLSQFGPLTFTEYTRFISQSLHSIKEIDYNNISTDNKHSKNEISQIPIEISHMSLCCKCIRCKPERTHHCSQCNKCVLKMDHHCPWIGNCIGLLNYKYFLLALIYTFASSTIVLITFWDSIIMMLMSSRKSLNQCILCIFSYICNAIVCLFSGYLAILNMKLVLINKTTIELADEARFSSIQQLPNVKVNKNNTEMLEYSKYNKGILTNLKEVFGNCFLLWGLPTCGPRPNEYFKTL